MAKEITAKLTEHLDEELVNKVIKWFNDRKLNNGNPLKQYEKFREETEEILDSLNDLGPYGSELLKGQRNEFIDGIGDTLVVMIGILLQTKKGKGIDQLEIRPALSNDDANVRIKEAILKTSDHYCDHQLDLPTAYKRTFIEHSVDNMRSLTSSFIFDLTIDNSQFAMVKYTSMIMCHLRDMLSIGAHIFTDEEMGTMTLNDCLSIAYEEIKDRKGLYINGKFIKEADFTEEQRNEFEKSQIL